LIEGLEVPEFGDDVEGVVDGVAAAPVLPQYLPVFESGNDMLDAGSDPAVLSVVVVADDRPVLSRVGVVMVSTPR
jgi:hypothetical protein